MVDPVDLRALFPWLDRSPLRRVHVDAEHRLREDLSANSFELLSLEGAAITTQVSAHDELALTFGFPDYYGRNWAAFNDSVSDFAKARAGGRVAVFWRDIAATGREAPDVTAELGWALLGLRDAWAARSDATDDVWVQFELFAVGRGEEFCRP